MALELGSIMSFNLMIKDYKEGGSKLIRELEEIEKENITTQLLVEGNCR